MKGNGITMSNLSTSAAPSSRLIVLAKTEDHQLQGVSPRLQLGRSVYLGVLASLIVAGKLAAKVPRALLQLIVDTTLATYRFGNDIVSPRINPNYGFTIATAIIQLCFAFAAIPIGFGTLGIVPITLFMVGLMSQQFASLAESFSEEFERLMNKAD